MLATLLPFLLAPAVQQDLFVQPVTQLQRPGALTQSVSYSDTFHSGWERDAHGRMRAMRYDGTVALELGAFVPGGESAGLGVDVIGRTVGWAEDQLQGALVRRPFIYSDANGLELIDLPQATEGWAEAISIFGIEAVGTMRRADGRLQAWDYAPDFPGTAVGLSTPAGWESEALAVNRETVAGLVRDPQGREFAAVWDFQRNLTILTTPGSGNARLTGVGHAGTDRACGWFVDAQGEQQGFTLDVTDPQNTLVVLPTLGGAWCRPADTDGWIIVGASENAQGESRAFEFEISTQQIQDLNDRANTPAGAELSEAASIAFGPHYALNGTAGSVQFGATARLIRFNVSTALAGSPLTFSVTNAPADSRVAFLYGFASGQTAVPGCPGLTVDLDQPTILATDVTTEFGASVQTIQVPPSAAGLLVFMQAVMPDQCVTTTVSTVLIQ